MVTSSATRDNQNEAWNKKWGGLLRTITLISTISAVAVQLLYTLPVQAQASRTWVSGVGDDANPCSRTAPCKTFAGAISKTAAGGEISVLDPGGYGAVTITKSISIIAAGAEGSILASGTNGIVIRAAPTDVVHLDGLFLEGTGTGIGGIRILSAAAVHIRTCLIRGFQAGTGWGIEIVPTATTQVFISGCTISKNIGGVLVKPDGAGTAQVFLEGIHVTNNAAIGIRADGRAAVIRLRNSIVAGNGTGLDATNGGSIVSFGFNAIAGNTTNGSLSETPK